MSFVMLAALILVVIDVIWVQRANRHVKAEPEDGAIDRTRIARRRVILSLLGVLGATAILALAIERLRSSGVRARAGKPSLDGRPGRTGHGTSFDVLRADFWALTGPDVASSGGQTLPDSYLGNYDLGRRRGRLAETSVGGDIHYVNVYLGSSSGWSRRPVSIAQSVLRAPLQVRWEHGAPGVSVDRCVIESSISQQFSQGLATPASVSGLVGTMSHVRVVSAVDGIDGLGGPDAVPGQTSLMDLCWIRPAEPYAYTSGSPWNGSPKVLSSIEPGKLFTTGRPLSAGQQAAAGATLWRPSEFVRAGILQRVYVSPRAGWWTIECVRDGVSGLGTAGRPAVQVDGGAPGGVKFGGGALKLPMTLSQYDVARDACFVLRGGSASYVVVGVQNHSDAMQWWSGGHARVTRSRIEGGQNSCAIIQAARLPREGIAVPTKLIKFDRCLFVPNPSDESAPHMMEVNGSAWLGEYGESHGTVSAGALVLDASRNWRPNPSAGLSRPWYVTINSCHFGDFASGKSPSFDECIQTFSRHGDRAIFVRTEAERTEAIARQYSISVDQARLLESPRFNWAEFSREPAAAVLNSRLDAFFESARVIGGDRFAHQGKVDARSWIVWGENRLAGSGLEVHPSGWRAIAGRFDAQGYYVGI